MRRIKSFINKKLVQRLLLMVWIITVLGVFVWHFVEHSYEHSQTYVDKRNIVSCKSPGATHRVEISDKGFNPQKLIANVCDLIVFVNTGQKFHEPAFGAHPAHMIYPGYEEEILKKNETNKFVLTAFGDYKVHDHIDDELIMELQIRAATTSR